MQPRLIQTKLTDFLKTPAPVPKEPISHRELILFLLQFGQWAKETNLYRALLVAIKNRRAKGHIVAWITWEKFQAQLYSLQREGLLDHYGVCWRLKLI